MFGNLTLLQQSSFLSKLLLFIDCVFIVALLRLITMFYGVEWSEHYNLLALQAFALTFLGFYSFQLYRSWRGVKLYKETTVILRGWATTVGVLLFLFFILKSSHHYSRAIILTWFMLSPVLIFLVHLLFRQILKVVRSSGKNLKQAVIVGAGEVGFKLARHIEGMPWAGIRIAGFFDDCIQDGDPSLMGKTLLGSVDSLPHFLKENKMDYVYIALPSTEEGKITAIIGESRTMGAALFMVPDLFMFKLINAEIESLGDMLLLNFNPYLRHKRYFDVIFSTLAILISLPLTLIIALLVKLEDGGPVFYGHRRITCMGKEFKCLKFRTMCVHAERKLHKILREDPKAREEWNKTFKLKKDPRVTGIGRLLRKTSLDELPQFINVLKGEMSVVGARPVVHYELQNFYKENAGLYCSMKPGITGLWQVWKRSDTEDYSERVRLDTWYVLNHSIWLDLKIILKTVLCMINGKGAY